ncbi:transcriptional repressor [Mariniphaga sediminis]|jgi:Fur family ferric uptake transcriptional regulator|uniref:Transcriptional repressor n=1 Tax=Mariniphaga sediminis TaxID=1628158 RepID=A0A399CZN8_9BACT|nr:transcriptional repressor [Mariniphaga sediminis]RIH65235.1 transcriptional repressor [Mariniphaga sediminis]
MNPNEVLHEHNLKRTGCREGIISVIMESGNPLSENEIRDRLSGTFDRTTFYRSFKTLQESKIIHKIVVDNQLVKYALDNTITQKQEHAHFYCEECQSVRCLESIPVKTPPLPDGFKATETEVIIKGLCDKCQKNIHA